MFIGLPCEFIETATTIDDLLFLVDNVTLAIKFIGKFMQRGLANINVYVYSWFLIQYLNFQIINGQEIKHFNLSILTDIEVWAKIYILATNNTDIVTQKQRQQRRTVFLRQWNHSSLSLLWYTMLAINHDGSFKDFLEEKIEKCNVVH